MNSLQVDVGTGKTPPSGLRRMCIERGLSTAAVVEALAADGVHVKQATVRNWMAGYNIPRPEFMPPLARLLHIDMDELIGVVYGSAMAAGGRNHR